MGKSRDLLKCSFCGKSADCVQKMITNGETNEPICICDLCVINSLDIMGLSTEFNDYEREVLQKKALELRKLLYTIPVRPT